MHSAASATKKPEYNDGKENGMDLQYLQCAPKEEEASLHWVGLSYFTGPVSVLHRPRYSRMQLGNLNPFVGTFGYDNLFYVFLEVPLKFVLACIPAYQFAHLVTLGCFTNGGVIAPRISSPALECKMKFCSCFRTSLRERELLNANYFLLMTF